MSEADDAEKHVRLRRTNSVTRAQEITEKETKQRAFQPDQPCHQPHDSLLSSSSGYTNYRGVLNLCIVLLVLSNARVALENIIKYGILVDPLQWSMVFAARPYTAPSLFIVLGLNVFISISLLLETLLAKGRLTEKHGRYFILTHLALVVAVPATVAYLLDCHPIGASAALGLVSIAFLKLVSYHMVNYWCRDHQSKSGTRRRRRSFSMSHSVGTPNGIPHQEMVRYPDNLTFKDMYYFMFAPTLCYELNFPRSQRIRKRFLIKRCLEMLVLLQLMLALVQQWLVPTIRNSRGPLKDMDYSRMLERLLKLAVPNHLVWLIMFYWFFHSSLNAIAELLKFADRQFYRDWWNAETVNYFWANWNVPVHRWCVRHIYKPLMARGFQKFHASVAVFFVSAFFHEYLVSIPLKMFRIWAFSGMLGQLPFAMFVSRFLHHQYGNMAVWISLIIGQPLCILMYYHDYYVTHFGGLDVA